MRSAQRSGSGPGSPILPMKTCMPPRGPGIRTRLCWPRGPSLHRRCRACRDDSWSSGPQHNTDLVQTAQRASPARVQPAMKHAFVGFIHGAESELVSDGETAIYSDGESSFGETESLYQLQDCRIGGCSDGDNISGPLEPPNRVAIFMDGT